MKITRRGLLAGVGGAALGGGAVASAQQQQSSRPESPDPACVARTSDKEENSHPASVDVFLIGGQSNAVGDGDATQSPSPPDGTAYEYDYSNDKLIHLEDPVDGATDGSAWAPFGTRYEELTGRKAVYVPAATSGTAMHPDAKATNGVWGPTGSLLDRAAGRLSNCMDHIETNDLFEDPAVYRGMLWHQGERDSNAIDNDKIIVDDYKSAFDWFLDELRNNFPYDGDLFMFQIGRPDSGDTDGFSNVRQAQVDITHNNSDVPMVYDKCVTFPDRGMMYNELHYNQKGLNEMGKEGAEAVESYIYG